MLIGETMEEREVKQVQVHGWVVGVQNSDCLFEFRFLSPTEPKNLYTNQVSFPVRGFLANDED
jgi:hypothetical protein